MLIVNWARALDVRRATAARDARMDLIVGMVSGRRKGAEERPDVFNPSLFVHK